MGCQVGEGSIVRVLQEATEGHPPNRIKVVETIFLSIIEYNVFHNSLKTIVSCVRKRHIHPHLLLDPLHLQLRVLADNLSSEEAGHIVPLHAVTVSAKFHV